MTGKQKCQILKEIRAEIARQNDINLVIEACMHKGECRGTCPRCESEVRYLERELEKRRRLKKAVALAGISAGMTVALSGCAVMDTIVESPVGEAVLNALNPSRGHNPEVVLDGMVPSNYEYDGEIELAGEVALDDVPEAEPEAPDAD